MIDKKEVIRFFDDRAADWDKDLVRSDAVINGILDRAGVKKGTKVLDVACGTGVLIPDYLAREVESVTAVDISPEMIAQARKKCTDERVRFLCIDAEELPEGEKYDVVMVYNAFPHFPEPEKLIAHLSGLLKEGGSLTVAHGSSRAVIDSRHHGSAAKVSNGLMYAEELSMLFSRYTKVTVMISDDTMYQVTGEAVSAEERAAQEGEHDHVHAHGSGQEHSHSHAIPMDILLEHMLDHNRSHISELEQIADHLTGVSRDCLLKAIGTLELGCDQLDQALKEMRLDGQS